MMSKKKNVVLLCGYDMGTIPDKIRNFERVPRKGDWRRFKIIEDITYKMATVNWQLLNSSEWADDVLPVTCAKISPTSTLNMCHFIAGNWRGT